MKEKAEPEDERFFFLRILSTNVSNTVRKCGGKNKLINNLTSVVSIFSFMSCSFFKILCPL